MSLDCLCFEIQTSSTSEMVLKNKNKKSVINHKTIQFAYAGHSLSLSQKKSYKSKIYIYIYVVPTYIFIK